MKPIIGITSDVDKQNNQKLNDAYVQAIIRAGGLPIVLPTGGVEEDAVQLAMIMDGLLVTGGDDINPLLFGEEPHKNLGEVSPDRDASELELVWQMLSLNKPILGICRGQQILNVAMGGTMFQDIHSQHHDPLLQHMQKARRDHLSHFVQVESGSLLESIAEMNKIRVNSFHHQAVKDVPSPLIITGYSTDGIVEAIESTDHHFVLGVQWHPEELAKNGDEISLRIFERFLDASLTIKQ